MVNNGFLLSVFQGKIYRTHTDKVVYTRYTTVTTYTGHSRTPPLVCHHKTFLLACLYIYLRAEFVKTTFKTKKYPE